MSEEIATVAGGPQGSVLGPMTYALQIGDLTGLNLNKWMLRWVVLALNNNLRVIEVVVT